MTFKHSSQGHVQNATYAYPGPKMNTRQVRVEIGVGEYMKPYQSPVG